MLRVLLVDRQVLRPAVLLAGGGEDDAHLGVVVAAGLQHRELAGGVDRQIGEGVAHRVDVTDLSGEVKEVALPANEVLEADRVAHVGDVDAHPIPDAVDVEEVAARAGEQRIDQRHPRAECDEAAGQGAADEAQAPRHQHRRVGEGGGDIGGRRRGRGGAHRSPPARGAGAATEVWPTGSRLTRSCHQKERMLVTVRQMRGRLKNCDLP